MGKDGGLLAVARNQIRTRHMSFRTEKTYLHWMHRFILFHERRHPREMGAPEVVIHNAVGGAFGSFREVEAETLAANFQVNTMALFHLARRLTPAMVERGTGALIGTGNTAALRGRAQFAGFAPTKAAQRILAESIARDLGPKGVHVAYIVIDAVIDVPWARTRFPQAPDDFFVKPSAIADEVWHLVRQDRSAWSFNVEIRPYKETW